ncbi:MAG: hypothetical protein DSM106950_44900 [Stigonema ocellatum SAG 48.90 = DSM 106950]|nr:hypothetical protein [Stigonema ocellatum SAG 48.90 = DSM 106950]
MNNSGDTLCFYYTTGEPLPDKNPFNSNNRVSGELPDTTDRSLNDRILLPYENKMILNPTGQWDPDINRPSSDSAITFFTFSTRTVRTIPWNTIKREKLYKSYKFTWDQIQASDWQLKIVPK